MVFIFSLISDTLLWKYGFSAEEDLAKAEIEHSLSYSRIAPAGRRVSPVAMALTEESTSLLLRVSPDISLLGTVNPDKGVTLAFAQSNLQ